MPGRAGAPTGELAGAGGTGAGAGGGEVAGAGGGVVSHFPCEEPQALPGGFVSCASGMVHRATPGMCPSTLPRDGVGGENAGGAAGVCSDSACAAERGDQAFCTVWPYCEGGASPDGPLCFAGCTSDAGCESNELCLCGEHFEVPLPTGLCVPAACRRDQDCNPGSLCTLLIGDHYEPRFVCQRPDDECGGDLDCQASDEDSRCTRGSSTGPRVCDYISGQCGGP